MELFSPSYLNFLLYIVLSIAVLYVIGHFIVGSFVNNENKNISLFLKLFAAYVASVSIFAIIWTSGNSVFLLLVLLFIVFIYDHISFQKKKISARTGNLKKLEIKQLFVLFIFTVGFYSLTYYIFFNNGIGNIWCDYPVYAIFTHNIEQTHTEGAYIFSQTMTTDKYHYADIWPNVIVSFLFSENYLHVYLLVVIPLFAAMIFQGGLAVSESMGMQYILLSLIFGLIVLFVKPITILLNSNIYFAFIDYPKLGGVFLFFLASALLYIQKKHILSGLTILALIAFYTPAAPGVIGGLLAAVLFYNYKQDNKLINRYVLYVISGALFYLLFYYVFNTGTISHNSTTGYTFAWALWFVLKKILVYVFSFSLSIIIILGIYKIFGFREFNLFKPTNTTYYIGLFALAGLIFSAIVSGVYSMISIEGSQILKAFAAPLFSILFYILLAYIFSNIASRLAIIASFILLIGLILNSLINNSGYFFGGGQDDWEKVNSGFYYDIKDLIKTENNEYAYIREYPEANDFFGHFYRIMSFPPLHKISHFTGVYKPYCLSVFDIPQNIPIKYDDRHLSLFYQYVQDQKERKNFISLSQSQIQFIKDYNIGYLIVERNAVLSPELLNLTDQKIVDSHGNTFYVLAE